MSKSLDQLAKNLANGMSRRKALWTFITSLGVVTAFTGRKAYAGGLVECAGFCDAQALLFVEACLQASRSCGPGYCADFSIITINAGSLPYSCVPVLRINQG
jgi:hypothetical protein